MERDVRDSALYREAATLYGILRRPGTGQISDAAEVDVSPLGNHAVFVGSLMDALEGVPLSRICLADLSSGDTRVITFGPNVDRLPKYSPDGRRIAFLSDRHRAGDFQLYLLDPSSGAARPTPYVNGWVEYLHWSPDGARVLLGVAGHGADIAGGQGAVTSKQASASLPAWMPRVETGAEAFHWRRVWIYELANDRVREVPTAGANVWEAVWCGNQSLAAVVSPSPAEGSWYEATFHTIDVHSGESRQLYAPKDQLGCPAASPSGKQVAVVEAVCSDRGIVAGELRLIESSSATTRRIDTRDVSITTAQWRSDRQLLVAGVRGFQTVVGLYDAMLGVFNEVWASAELSTAGASVSVSGLNETGDCVLVAEGFVRAPEIAVIRGGEYRTLKSFDLGYAEQAGAIAVVEPLSWQAQDGIEIEGWLLRPKAEGPLPLIMNVHGGPVSHWRPVWLGRPRGVPSLMLVKAGYAIFLPNPRGSSGRGQDFARRVLGDMGGADAYDCLSGLDHLVERDIADPKRLGVMGISYGGFMTSWLITQDARFAAAVPVAPICNHVTEHLISNIPQFVKLFLADSYTNPSGRYFQRSPIMHADKVRTPTMIVCGALDRCTPPEEAVQFHNALREHGVNSVLVTYPEEGHGVRKFPAAIDYAARIVNWFQEHMPAPSPTPRTLRTETVETSESR